MVINIPPVSNKKVFLKYFFALLCICMLIVNTEYHTTPVFCHGGAWRLMGLSVRDLLTTIVGGSLLGYCIESNPIKGIIILFISAIIIHIVFNAKTMLNYNFGLCDKPDGMGYIPNCVNYYTDVNLK